MTAASIPWWHLLKPHPLLRYVPRHSAQELDELEKRVRAAGTIRDPIRLVSNNRTGEKEIIDGMGRWEAGRRTHIEPQFEDLGCEDEVDVAAIILDYATRRSISAEQKVQMYMDLNEHSEAWNREREEATVRANLARAERAKVQHRGARGQFAGKLAGEVTDDTRPANRERDRIASLTGTSPATVSRVLARRRGARTERPTWKTLRHVLGTTMKSLESACKFSRELHVSEIANELELLRERARQVKAKVEAEFAGGPEPDEPGTDEARDRPPDGG